MKPVLFSLACIFISTAAAAQDCKSYYYLTNNAEVQMTIYNNKGKESGRQTWKISDVKNIGKGYQATVNSVFTDEKGKEGAKGTGIYKCESGVLKADMKMAISPEQMQAYKDMEVKADEVYIEYPPNLSTGQALPDADFKMEMSGKNGMPGSTINFKETARKVEGKESVTSPAGTWEAYKISYTGEMKVKNVISISREFKVTEWFVPNFGVVKTESYNKNGKLQGSTLITSLKK